jgi:hypothetical protein
VYFESFYNIRLGEIYKKSQCIEHEWAVVNVLYSMLTHLGYQKCPDNPRGWKKNNRTVIVCLGDDFSVIKHNPAAKPGQWFDSNTMIITDNHMPYPTDYEVCVLPPSYFGVFNYVPADQDYSPERRFHLSVNRLDTQRLLFLLEFTKQAGSIHNVIENDFINFNARATGAENTPQDAKNSVSHCWTQLATNHADLSTWYEQILPHMPLRNHKFTVEQVHTSAYLNLVIETYAGDASIAFSEKIFRALVTPAPWQVFSAKNAVQRLRTLGFDVLDHIVDHSYDTEQQDNSVNGHKKITNFVCQAMYNYNTIKQINHQVLLEQCHAAADHNQQLLAQMQRRWPADFANWLPQVISKLQ